MHFLKKKWLLILRSNIFSKELDLINLPVYFQMPHMRSISHLNWQGYRDNSALLFTSTLLLQLLCVRAYFIEGVCLPSFSNFCDFYKWHCNIKEIWKLLVYIGLCMSNFKQIILIYLLNKFDYHLDLCKSCLHSTS